MKGGNRQIKQFERIQNGGNLVEGNNSGRFFEVSATNKIDINRINLHECIGKIS